MKKLVAAVALLLTCTTAAIAKDKQQPEKRPPQTVENRTDALARTYFKAGFYEGASCGMDAVVKFRNGEASTGKQIEEYITRCMKQAEQTYQVK